MFGQLILQLTGRDIGPANGGLTEKQLASGNLSQN